MRLINADDVLRFIEDEIEESKEEKADAQARNNDNDTSYNCGEIQEARRIMRRILESPTIDAVPVVHSRWIHDGPAFRGGVDWWRCSICGNRDSAEWMRYCPTCGAKMDGGDGA